MWWLKAEKQDFMEIFTKVENIFYVSMSTKATENVHHFIYLK